MMQFYLLQFEDLGSIIFLLTDEYTPNLTPLFRIVKHMVQFFN